MPGFVAFGRRWNIASDDFLLPGLLGCALHTVCKFHLKNSAQQSFSLDLVVSMSALLLLDGCQMAVAIIVVIASGRLDLLSTCQLQLHVLHVAMACVLVACAAIELLIVVTAARGTIADTVTRDAAVRMLLYARLVVMLMQVVCVVTAVVWLHHHYTSCVTATPFAKTVIIGVLVSDCVAVCGWLITGWCVYDAAGRYWLKMKRYQQQTVSITSSAHRRPGHGYKRSSANTRSWRQRRVLRVSQHAWHNRCRLLCCCVDHDRNKSSFADIASLLSEFFRDLDVVPSDIVAGLMLLRQAQRAERRRIIEATSNNVMQFLSGARITPNTTFLGLNNPAEMELFHNIVYYMRFAMAIYGWPLFMMDNSLAGCCKLFPYMRYPACCCRCSNPDAQQSGHNTGAPFIVDDNCCACNTAPVRRLFAQLQHVQLVYATYHVDVGETPFMVAVDHHQRTVVVCVRGTMSMKDAVTDLDCDGEPIPTVPLRDGWLAHKGMVQAAVYIRDKLMSERLLDKAFVLAKESDGPATSDYHLVLLGHSLGAGTAAILAILLRDTYQTLQCFAYSPPGGSLSMPAVEYSRRFTIGVVVGKDLVPRIGLNQMEQLRSDLVQLIDNSRRSKWSVIGAGFCCGGAGGDVREGNSQDGDARWRELLDARASKRSDVVSTRNCINQPLFPPGRLVHVVRRHGARTPSGDGATDGPGESTAAVRPAKIIYQAVWVENNSLDEVLISPVMVQDHMPDRVLEALEKVLACHATDKSQREPIPTSPPEDRVMAADYDKKLESRLCEEHQNDVLVTDKTADGIRYAAAALTKSRPVDGAAEHQGNNAQRTRVDEEIFDNETDGGLRLEDGAKQRQEHATTASDEASFSTMNLVWGAPVLSLAAAPLASPDDTVSEPQPPQPPPLTVVTGTDSMKLPLESACGSAPDNLPVEWSNSGASADTDQHRRRTMNPRVSDDSGYNSWPGSVGCWTPTSVTEFSGRQLGCHHPHHQHHHPYWFSSRRQSRTQPAATAAARCNRAPSIDLSRDSNNIPC